MRTLSLTVTEETAGRKVKSLLYHRLAIPESMIASIKLRETGICLNGVRCRTTDTVSVGDVLTAEIGDIPAETGIEPVPIPPDIRYEDEDLLVLNKPAGLATHGKALRGDPTVANMMAAYRGTLQSFHPVTRLDRGTSGLMVIAKSGFVHERLRRMLHTEDLVREYLAIVCGTMPETRGSILLPLKKDESGQHRFCTAEDGACARTDYTVLDTGEGGSLLRLRLFTGRTHQIRVHLSAAGCPIVGDVVYGTPSPLIGRPALHSAFLCMTQPITGEQIRLEAPLPEDMEEVWRSMK